MRIHKTLALLLLFALCSCNSNKVTDINDYQAFLTIDTKEINQNEDINFWSNKINNAPNQYPYLVKRASAYTTQFSNTGNIENLIKAEEDLLLANTMTNHNNAGYLKALAHNYVSQHRFKEALTLLEKAEVIGEKLKGTQKMLFDVHLELGNDTEAQRYLGLIKDFSDFDYLIRLAKWEDHNGNLEGAITYMERATKISESGNTKNLKQWSYTNLADFYGHAGKIDLSYKYYLKALKLDPNDAYAKKGIAWITYSHEKNPDQALSILTHITDYYQAPDYQLLIAEIAEFKKDNISKENALTNYRAQVADTKYGAMYNKYNVLHFTDDLTLPEQAIALAKEEVKNRPTTQSYDLLAWSYFKNGNIGKATAIIDDYVIGKTEEPNVLYHIAEIYKANGRTEEVSHLKKELIASVYELGPLLKTKIERL